MVLINGCSRDARLDSIKRLDDRFPIEIQSGASSPASKHRPRAVVALLWLSFLEIETVACLNVLGNAGRSSDGVGAWLGASGILVVKIR